MSPEAILRILKEGMLLILSVSAVPMLSGMIVGLIVSLLQATTQIQQQTLKFVPKRVAIIMVLVFMGPLGAVELIDFTRALLSNFYRHVH